MPDTPILVVDEHVNVLSDNSRPDRVGSQILPYVDRFLPGPAQPRALLLGNR